LSKREEEAADVTLSTEELDGAGNAGCVLQAHLARLPRGGVLEFRGGDPEARERWRERCQGLDEPLPSAIDHLLAALAADLISSFAACADERAVAIDVVECRLSARLDDPLASIGVVGAAGSPALAAVDGTVYVSAEAEESVLRGAWCAALRRAPLFNALATGASLRIEMRVEP